MRDILVTVLIGIHLINLWACCFYCRKKLANNHKSDLSGTKEVALLLKKEEVLRTLMEKIVVS